MISEMNVHTIVVITRIAMAEENKQNNSPLL